MVTADEARHLVAADLYVLSPQMCHVVTAAAQSLTVDDLALLDPDDLPGMSGLVVLPQPILVTSVGGDLSDHRGYAWHSPVTVGPVREPDGVRMLDAVRISLYNDTHGPVRPPDFLGFAAHAARLKTPLPPLLLDAVRALPFHPGGDTGALAEMAAAARRVGAAWRAASNPDREEDESEGQYVIGAAVNDTDDTFATRFLYAFWRLCEQRVAAITDAPVNHSARILADRAGVSPDVRVIQLRHADRAGADAASHDWHHQWVVRMHKVRQWYPSQQQHKIIYRGPYLKGPAGKPLLGGDTVRGLVR